MVKQLVLFCSNGSLRIFEVMDARIKQTWLARRHNLTNPTKQMGAEMENCGQEKKSDDRWKQMRTVQRLHCLAMILKDAY